MLWQGEFPVFKVLPQPFEEVGFEDFVHSQDWIKKLTILFFGILPASIFVDSIIGDDAMQMQLQILSPGMKDHSSSRLCPESLFIPTQFIEYMPCRFKKKIVDEAWVMKTKTIELMQQSKPFSL